MQYTTVKKLFVAVGVMILGVAAYAGYIVVTMPDVESLQKKNPTITALMEQRAEEKDVAPRPIRAWIPYKTISPHLRNAVLIAEDSAFFQHSGYDFEQIKRRVACLDLMAHEGVVMRRSGPHWLLRLSRMPRTPTTTISR